MFAINLEFYFDKMDFFSEFSYFLNRYWLFSIDELL